MFQKLAFLCLLLALCLTPAVRAANIIWVGENIDITGDGTPDDFAWIPWLQSLGYNVDVRRGNWTTLDAAKIAELNAADLIIISRCTSSGNYNNDATEIAQWSGITAPILNLAAHFVRNNRWYWFNTATIDPIVGPMMEVLVPSHPIFTGINVDANKQVAVVDGTTGSGQTSFIGTTDPGNGTLLAKTGTHAWIVEWQPGKPFYPNSPQMPAGKRLLFSAGTQEVSPTPIGAFNLTEQGKKMLSNAILYMLGKPVVEGLATDPKPATDQTDVPADVTLTWTAGQFAQTHDVYVGLSLADVNNASRTNPLGVLASQGQSAGSFAPANLQYGQTYYWRVDEVNAPPSTRIVKGEIWSFTVEPLGYPITNVTATASSSQPGMGPENTVNGSGSFIVGGGGTDIWNVADQFRFAAQRLTGNGAIVAKVENVVNTDPWAKVGVMIRESLAPGSKFAAIYATPGNGVRYQARLLTDSAATSDTAVATAEQTALKTPIWVKIERSGSSFSGYYSADGVQWTAMSWNPQTINMAAASVYIGLCVTSHNANALTTGEFSNVATAGGATGAWEVAEIGVAQPGNAAAQLYVVIQDSAGKSKMVNHPDPAATTLVGWQEWRIPLGDLSDVNLAAVKKLTIGVGDRANPSADGAGRLYIDDIGFDRPAQAK